ncbi:hypothetical protein AK812_SmicGene7011 [Symbiodinium microadriaticum]|uniref:Uncharacterized protein n=1 Tax=Symbiodinium microadriaticum TaxID=2951 RepID=A0A1Q9EPM0_SYMMI|nr:hypothetical protein AK812_SmicGene7011 [Symbiodinium microadriaticum]
MPALALCGLATRDFLLSCRLWLCRLCRYEQVARVLKDVGNHEEVQQVLEVKKNQRRNGYISKLFEIHELGICDCRSRASRTTMFSPIGNAPLLPPCGLMKKCNSSRALLEGAGQDLVFSGASAPLPTFHAARTLRGSSVRAILAPPSILPARDCPHFALRGSCTRHPRSFAFIRVRLSSVVSMHCFRNADSKIICFLSPRLHA